MKLQPSEPPVKPAETHNETGLMSSAPKLYGAFIRKVGKAFIGGIRKGSVTTRASSIAFLMFLASLPSIIFFFSLIPFIPVQNFRLELLDIIQALLPVNASESILRNIDFILIKRKGIPIMGFAIAMYFAANAIIGIIDAFNTTIHTVETRAWGAKIRIAVILVLIISILITASVSLIVFEKIFMLRLVSVGILHLPLLKLIVVITRWIIISVLIFTGISFLYYLGPAKHNYWRFITVGSFVATVLTLVASLGFSFFVNHYAPFNRIYGSIGTIMATMIWMYFNSLALLLGFELNASVRVSDTNKS